MIKKISFAILLIITFIMIITYTTPCIGIDSTEKVNIAQSDTMFEVAEGNSLIEINPQPLSKDLLNKRGTFFGRLHDTGVLNLFYTYTFDGINAYSKTYYLKERIYNKPYSSIWCKIIGSYSKIEEDKEEIDADSFEILNEIDEKIEKANKYVQAWIEKNRKIYNLNNYKMSNRFKDVFQDFKDLDLNKTEFQSDNTLIFFDFDRMIIGISCGRNILRENVQRGDYLSYLGIYDLTDMKLIKVIIKNTGYFLE